MLQGLLKDREINVGYLPTCISLSNFFVGIREPRSIWHCYAITEILRNSEHPVIVTIWLHPIRFRLFGGLGICKRVLTEGS